MRISEAVAARLPRDLTQRKKREREVAQIVTAHGGHIFIETAGGKGTMFDIAIPVQR